MTQLDYDFMGYVTKFNKSYGTKQEYLFRKSIFEVNDRYLKEFNEKPGQTSTMGHNKFSDYTE